jgi:hypothetical protein
MKKFQDLTEQNLNEIISKREEFILNYNQISVGTVNNDYDNFVELNPMINTPKEMNLIKAALIISDGESNRWNGFVIKVYENGGRVFYKNSNNHVDCCIKITFDS